MIFSIIRRIVCALCLLYTINVIISSIGKFVPINIYTIIIVSVYDVLGILAIIYLKYYL
jgi:pro-sigmaK processing inhibitor BofA